MKKHILSIIFFLAVSTAFSQGCIAVRSMATANGNPNSSAFMHAGQFQVSSNYRFLHSYKHFVGTVEQKQRVEQGTQVINDQHSFDFGLTYAITNRLNITLNVPLSFNDRSSLYEHYGNGTPAGSNPRFHTSSKGVGDMRLGASFWLFNPMTHIKGNIAIGVGIKAPTGNANVQDGFHKLDKDKKEYILVKAVDQSIQLGDSGWGESIEIQGYQSLFKNTSLYFNGFYLFSPKTLNAATGLSVPDQFGARVGLTYTALPKQGITFALGGRIEGLPALDAIGSSEGSRRPGYIISVEPSIIASRGNSALSVSIPYALVRNRTKSWVDMQDPTGIKHGDAAFADYIISATYVYRF